jgi:Undecaprenyl-phosphate glucose phosphotransferase
VIDGLALAAGAAASVLLAPQPVGALWPAVVGAILSFLLLPAMGSYAFAKTETYAMAMVRGVAAVGLVAAAMAAVQGVVGGVAGLSAALRWTLLTLVTLDIARAASLATVRRWRAGGRLTPNILVVGATENAKRLVEGALETREVAVLGVFDDRSDRIAPTVHGVPVLGDTRALIRHRILPYVDRIVLTVNAAGPARTAELIERLRVLPNDLCLFLDADDARSRAATLSWLSRATGGGREGPALAKRAQDLILGTALLVLATPVMLATALAVRLDSPGPVLFRQRRHGFNNEEILVWKFRSMRSDATDAAGARQVSAGDPRVTRVGRFIRKTSLDELPQLINVLQGRMSLVGPRPHPVGMKTAGQDSARLVAEYAWRHRIKPGITGWAQINGSRGPVDTAEQVRRRVELDVDYIERQSFAFDLFILVMTLPRLLGDRAAVR